MISRRAESGLSLLEVLVAGMVLALCAATLGPAMLTSMDSTRQSAQYTAAAFAARQKLEELTTTNFDDLITKFGNGYTFKVYENCSNTIYDVSGNKIVGNEMPGIGSQPAGEVVVVYDEGKMADKWGRTLSELNDGGWPDFGQPGGITFSPLPIDLDGDGDASSGDLSTDNVSKSKIVRMPVGVVIRWQGPRGPDRYELWTVVSRY